MSRLILYASLVFLLASCASIVSKPPVEAPRPWPRLKGSASLAVFAFAGDESVTPGLTQISLDAEFENVVRSVLPVLAHGRKIEFLEPPADLRTKGLDLAARRKVFGALGAIRADRVMGLYVVQPPGGSLKLLEYFPWIALSAVTLGLVPLYRDLPITTGVIVWNKSGDELYSQTIEGDLRQWFWSPLLFFKGSHPIIIGGEDKIAYEIYSGLVAKLMIDANGSGALGQSSSI